MSVRTEDLIAGLAAEAAPVRRLPAPGARAVVWLALAVPYAAAVVAWNAPRPDLAERLADPRFLLEGGAALATALSAAAAAFLLTVPGRSRRWALLPLVPLLVWLFSVGEACVQDYVRLGPEGIALRMDWDCYPALVQAGALPAIVMLVMLRRGAPLAPRLTLALGGLAVGAMANVGLLLFHVGDVSIMVLVWHIGSVLLLAALAGAVGRILLRWRTAPPRTS